MITFNKPKPAWRWQVLPDWQGHRKGDVPASTEVTVDTEHAGRQTEVKDVIGEKKEAADSFVFDRHHLLVEL